MQIDISPEKAETGRRAAAEGATRIRQAITERGECNVIVATGASQFEMIRDLTAAPEIDWSVVTFFHLDEYCGMTDAHPASFRKYLKERLVARLPHPPRVFHDIRAEGDSQAECARLGDLIRRAAIDVAFIGIGENGHLAFNDPPADFKTQEPYIIVQLDDACRRQQFGEGWFKTLDAVPREAISMSVRQIMKSRAIVCTVPDERKAAAVAGSLGGPITPDCPASILQQHEQCTIFLDEPAASRLAPDVRRRYSR